MQHRQPNHDPIGRRRWRGTEGGTLPQSPRGASSLSFHGSLGGCDVRVRRAPEFVSTWFVGALSPVVHEPEVWGGTALCRAGMHIVPSSTNGSEGRKPRCHSAVDPPAAVRCLGLKLGAVPGWWRDLCASQCDVVCVWSVRSVQPPCA